ncbi:MAG: hypothetical protein IJ800_03305, partial [Clostridia bacterium]|nr:hypothetical protein [Clostridia bacterium]
PSLKKTYNYDMRLMRMPVISSIREKTSITNDETLAAVIRAIDAGKTYEDLGISGVSESDYNTVFKARNIHNLGGGVSNMAVPSYASAKELALDFVRYFATDKAQEIFIEKTYGGSSGFIFDLKVKNPSLYDKVSLINRDKFDFISDKNVTVMPGTTIYPLVYKGGLGNLHAMQYDSFAHKFGTPDATTGEYVTGESLYNADIEYYTESRWKVLLSMSGY